MKQPKVSIIVPVYNVEKYLDRCMQSLLGQTLKELEIILVDDGSPDNSPALCDNYESASDNLHWPIIKVIHKINEGLGFARNSGLEIATGEYIAFLDSDDFVDVNMYEQLYLKAKAKDIDVVYCNCNIYKDKKHIYPRKDVEEEVIFRGREAVDDFLLDMIAPLPEYHHDVRYMMSVGHAIYRHSIFMEHRVQFVSEREFVSEDIIFDIDFLSHVRSVCYLPDCLHYYVVNPYSLSHTYDDAKYHKMVNLSRIIKERLAKIYSEEKYYLHYLRSVFFLLRNTVMRMVLAGETDQKMKDCNCIFCKIANGEIPSSTVYEDEDFRVILDLGPAAKGHALILPKEHFKDVTELDPKIAAKVLPLGAKLGTAMKKSLGCAGFNLVQNNGEAAGQTVFHFHVHVIPRYEGGPVIAGWEPGKEDPEVLAETAEKIKDAL